MAVQFYTSANTITTGTLPGPFSGVVGSPTVGIGDGVFGINTVHTPTFSDGVFFGNILISAGDGTIGFTIGFGVTGPAPLSTTTLLGVGTDGGLSVNPNGSLTAFGSSGSASSFGTVAGIINFSLRNYVEFECPLWNTVTSVCNVYVGGVKVGSGTLASFIGHPLFGNAPLNSVQLGNYPGAVFDSMYFLDTTGSINNAPLGPQVVGVIRPRAPGTKADWTPNGAGTDWQAVNNIPPAGDSIYISDSTTNDECSVELTTPSIFASISAVSVVTSAREETASGRTIAAGVGNGTTQDYGSNIALNTDYGMNTTVFNENPHTSAAWVLSDITTLQAAVKLTT